MDPKLISLPLIVQVALGSGYAAYCLAYMGIRQHHKPVDVTFSTLAFSVMTTIVLTSTVWMGQPLSAGIAILITLLSALIWRKFGRRLMRFILRTGDISWTDDSPSALATLSQDTDHMVSQIAVLLDDGTWLECRDTSKFSKSPFGPCVIGEGGDLGLYLTHKELPDGTTKELATVKSDTWGDRITYVPSARIREITIRHERRPSRLSLVGRLRAQKSSSEPSVESSPSQQAGK